MNRIKGKKKRVVKKINLFHRTKTQATPNPLGVVDGKVIRLLGREEIYQ